MAINDKENPAKEAPVKETLANETVQDKTEVLDNRIKRIDEAHACFKNYTMAAIAVGFVPAPLIDIAALTAIQLKMVHKISSIYDIPFSKNLVKSIIGSIVGGSVAVTLAMPAASLLKLVPILGQTSGMISTAAIGAASTYAIGKIFAEHFESGGTFLDFDEEKARAHFKELYEEGKAFVASQKPAATA